MGNFYLRFCTAESRAGGEGHVQKILQKIMTFQELAKIHFTQYLFIFQNNTLEFQEKHITMVMI